MNGKGMSQALCVACVSDTDVICMFGGKPSADVLGFTCNACSKFSERREQEKLFQTLKPPSPEKILRTIAGKFPWALTIARAEPDELFEALQTLKRKLSGHRTVAALADSLANTNSHAAVLLQNLAQNGKAGTDSSITSKALRSFVKNQCPSVKFKTLLLPPKGSIHKATRHFQDMLRVEDPLVVALAMERIFLCEWAETTYRPMASAKERRKGDVPELPEFALAILRSVFKSLSNTIKNNANKNEDNELMIKAWYTEHITWATTWALIDKPATRPMLAITNNDEPREPNHAPPFKGSGKKGKDKNYGKQFKGQSEALVVEPPSKMARTSQASCSGSSFQDLLNSKHLDLNSIVSEMYKSHGVEARSYWGENCRNCFLAGKGKGVKHSLFECQKSGNKCSMRCAKCRSAIHWISECTA